MAPTFAVSRSTRSTGTGTTIEMLYAHRTPETFGRGGAGRFWWPRRRGCSPDGPATGPFATSYSAYRHAMKSPTPFGWRRAAFADPQR